jgi:hypothetical protein
MSENKKETNIYKDLEKELLILKDRVSTLSVENTRLKEVLKENDLLDELPDLDYISVEEKLCLDGINHIADRVKTQQYDDQDIKNFDTLFKVLRAVRGQSVPDGKGKQNKTSVKDLLKIVEGN